MSLSQLQMALAGPPQASRRVQMPASLALPARQPHPQMPSESPSHLQAIHTASTESTPVKLEEAMRDGWRVGKGQAAQGYLLRNVERPVARVAPTAPPPEDAGVVWRRDFPLLAVARPALVYLDSAATAHKPASVVAAMTDFYTRHYATVHRGVYRMALEATEHQEAVRRQVQAFLNAPAVEDIVFTRGTTEATNLVAHCFGAAFVQPGDEVVVTEIEHHSNLLPWQLMCEARGARLLACRVTDKGDLDQQHLRQLLASGRVKLVACAHVSNAIGTVHPIREIAALAHRHGARLFVDGAQMAAHGRVDVQALGADFYAFSGHKVYGPTGIGVLYGRGELLRAMPPYHGGGEMVKRVTLSTAQYQEPPLKFEAGTPATAEIVGLGAAIDYLTHRGLSAIQLWEKQLLAYAEQRLTAIPEVEILGSPASRGPILSFVVRGCHHLDVGSLLDLRGVAVRTGDHCSQPAMHRFRVPGTVRLSLGLYNTKQDVDVFVDALRSVVQELQPPETRGAGTPTNSQPTSHNGT
eukprot:EG_transcript_9032